MLINSHEILKEAKEKKYAIAHFNINNLEWAKYILEVMQELNKPVILGVSESAISYMGGYYTVRFMIEGLLKDLNISIPVCLHLDHGKSFASCKKAIDAGFTSVMIDASDYDIETNVKITTEVVNYAKSKNVSVEAEIGHISKADNNLYDNNYQATTKECLILEKTGIDSLAPALGSAHGPYKGTVELDFARMKEISQALSIPLVLHGGTGIPAQMLKKSITCGINKININTELQIVWYNSIRQYIIENPDIYDPRKIINSGKNSIQSKIKEIVAIFYNTDN